MTDVQQWLELTGGRRGCPHPVHRFAQIRNSPASLILPECAGREAWLAARRDGIGGSEVGGLIGVNEHETTWSVWKKKVQGDNKDLSGLAPVEWGHRFEDAVAEKTAEEIGLASRFAGGLWADRERPFIRVTPDRFACKPRSWKAIGVIECKTSGEEGHWESGTIRPNGHGTGSAPLSYQAQIQWQMGILGLPIGWLGCYVSNIARDFFVVEVHFDAEWFAEMVNAATRFWTDNILGGVLPEHDLRHPITEDLLKAQHPDVIHAATQLPDGTDEWLQVYQDAKRRYEAADQDLTAAKNFFRMMTGDAGAGYLGEDKITSYPVINPKKGSIDVGMLREKYPDIAEECTVRNPHRRLTITVPGKYKIKDS